MGFLLLLTGCLTFPFLHWTCLRVVTKVLPGRSKSLYYALATRLVSLIQAVCASSVGLQVVLNCNDIMNDRFPSVIYYAWFGLSYFYYDLGAMFLESYHSYPKDCLSTILQRFLVNKWLIVLHHIFLPIVGFPVVVFFRRGYGDFFVGCIFLAEMSTPFLSMYKMLRKLDMQKSIIFQVNGFLLAISFFIGRILVFPFMYYSYAKYANVQVGQVPFKIPLICNITCLGLFILQLVWFIAIVRGGVGFIKTFIYRGIYETQRFKRKIKNAGEDVNSTTFSNGKQE